MTGMELHSSKNEQQTAPKNDRTGFSTRGFISFLLIMNSHQKGCTNPFLSIQPGQGGWPPKWISKLRGSQRRPKVPTVPRDCILMDLGMSSQTTKTSDKHSKYKPNIHNTTIILPSIQPPSMHICFFKSSSIIYITSHGIHTF